MYILIIFIVLSLVQFTFIYMKWSDIQDYTELAGEFATVTTVSKRGWYKNVLKFIAKTLVFFKKILLIPLAILILLNILISSILGGFLHLLF